MSPLRSLLSALLGRPDPELPPLARLRAPERPRLLYAIGDVHGCLEPLLAIEDRIIADAGSEPGEKWIVMLGDYIDRGPKSAQVIDHLLAPPPRGFRRICLRGNHEAAMLAALADSSELSYWMALGGDATLASYGLGAKQLASLEGASRAGTKQQLLDAHIPDEHRQFLAELPAMLTVPGYVFVHAGLRPGVALDAQADRDLLWIRGEFLDADHDFGSVVVHGHTPAAAPFLSARRVGIDTGCFASGRLTAVRVDDDGVRVV